MRATVAPEVHAGVGATSRRLDACFTPTIGPAKRRPAPCRQQGNRMPPSGSEPRPAPRLDRIDHIHLYVADRARAEAWYAQVMGLARVEALAFWAAGGGPLTLADAHGAVHLALFERAAQPCRSTIALGCSADAFMAWRSHLAQHLGREPKPVDHAVSWSLYFEDPDGNPFEITCHEHAALRARMVAADG